MKRYHILPAVAAVMMLLTVESRAQEQTAQNDSTLNAIKIQNLRTRREALRRQIASEDKKRNAVIEGVSVETLERMNERQDSLCLALRSELTTVNLELRELGADSPVPQLMQQYNALMHQNRPDTVQAAPVPAVAVPSRRK